jgi:hypothetical protein
VEAAEKAEKVDPALLAEISKDWLLDPGRPLHDPPKAVAESGDVRVIDADHTGKNACYSLSKPGLLHRSRTTCSAST